jgi:xanthine dehydrogenase small subunit
MRPFLLNDGQIEELPDSARPTLGWLRDELGLTAAKAGCNEGDCGACAVLLGARESGGTLRYRLVNSCLLPLRALGGHHLVTLEGLNHRDGSLTPVQQALLDEDAAQCGFCTPGMVMGLTHWLLTGRRFDREEVLESLDGNFCRCTGYQAIRRAADRLAPLGPGLPPPGERLSALISAGVLPGYFEEIPRRVAKLPPPVPGLPIHGALPVAGGTDLFVHPPPEMLHAPMVFLEEQPELHGIRVTEDICRIGATTTVEELLESALLEARIPHLHGFLARMGGTPVRDRATVGGNLVNASPIGDLSICLLALEATVVLQAPTGERRVPLSRFFLDYKTLDRQPDEIVSAAELRLPDSPTRFNFEKVAHREHLDIAAVNSALHLDVVDGVIRRAGLSAGGVAPTPLWLDTSSTWLAGRRLDAATVLGAAERAAAQARPIDDVRGSAAYKRLLLKRLVLAHFLTLTPEALPEELIRELISGSAPA